MDSRPQGELRGPQMPIPGKGTVISADNRAIIDSSTGVIERTNAAPSSAADWGTIASPMGPIEVDSDVPLSLRELPEPQVRRNLFAAGPISPIVDQLHAENRRVGPSTPDPYDRLGPAREAVVLIQQALSGSRQNSTIADSSPAPMSGSRRFPSLVEESPALEASHAPPPVDRDSIRHSFWNPPRKSRRMSVTSGSPQRWNRGATMRERRLECWNVGPANIPLFPLPRCLPCPNLCLGPRIAPCLWRNPRTPATSWWRTRQLLSVLLWTSPQRP